MRATLPSSPPSSPTHGKRVFEGSGVHPSGNRAYSRDWSTGARRYLQMYQTGGVEGLKELNFYRPQSELVLHREQLKAEFEACPAKSINEAVQRIETLTGLRRSPTQVRKFLKGLGVKRLKVGHIPAKADPQKQKDFLEEDLEPRLLEAKQGKRHLFFVDAAHHS